VNIGKRLVKRPKIYLRDSGLLHQLLGIPDDDTLRGHPVRGSSWEGFVIEQIISLLPDWEPWFYRTSHGAEFDLLMTRGERRLAFEIKVSTAPKLTKGFHESRRDIDPERTFVISRSEETWTNKGSTYTHVAALREVLGEF